MYLKLVWHPGTQGKGEEMRRLIDGKTGIIYFNNCFKRNKDKAGIKKGDHIDLWTGKQYYNQIIKKSPGGNATSGTDLFTTSEWVRFFALPH